MNRRIMDFHRDSQGHWVAELECGHERRLRHEPPFINRLWITTAEGRAAELGSTVTCKRCALAMAATASA